MKIDLDSFLAPVAEDDVAGPDLAYDPERFAIEQAFEVPAEEDGAAPGPSDWRGTIGLIVTQAARTKDLWLAIYLCRAAAHAGMLDVVASGTQALAGMLETFWDDVHPRLDDYGFQGRKGACDTLASFRGFIDPLGRMALLEHQRLGSFTAADLVRFHLGGADEDGYGLFRAALDDDAADTRDRLAGARDQIDAILDALQRSDAALTRHGDGETGTNFTPVYDYLRGLRNAVCSFAPTPGDDTQPISTGSPAGPGNVPAMLSGRDDVARTLDLVIDYYRRREPSSPIPLLLARAKAWIALDFIEILDDIAPRSTDDAKLVLQMRARP